MVAALAEGRAPDATLGEQAALRSLHNNYFTLPVLFIMVSGHYPVTYGQRLSWLILAGLAMVGVATRHWFNLRNQGRRSPWLLPGAALGMIALGFVTAPKQAPQQSVPAPPSAAGSFADVRVVIAQRCAACHSEAPTFPGLPAAPAGVVLDTPEHIRSQAQRIQTVAVTARTMPPGNVTGMTDDERELLSRWIREGAKLR
jgi:uncharacterized membrane protein